MEFTSQIGQDKWVCEALSYKRDGFFLDIGANNGVFFSNTLYLEKELGWSGVCIEPGLFPYRKLIKNRKCVCVRYFITDKNEIINFKEFHYGHGSIQGIQKVEGIRLDKLLPMLNCPEKIDYVSLDVEGVEDKVLSGFPFDKYQVSLWTIEHNLTQTGPELKNKIKEIMEKNDYRIVVEDLQHNNISFEDWYVHKSFDYGLGDWRQV